jgi:hypothetical protein
MAQPPRVPPADAIDGSETFFGIQQGRWKRFLASALKGQPGQPGASIKGDPGPAGKPKRVERYTATTNASGVAAFTFTPAFSANPDIQVITGWDGDQMISGGVSTQAATGCTVQAMISRGTLALSAGPFQKAPSGKSITIRAIGD